MEWRPLFGWEKQYEVSNTGLVRGLGKKKIILRPRTRYGYKLIGLGVERKTMGVHRAVLSTFGRPPTGREQCNHKDGNKANNNIENLEWVTAKENIAHAIMNGLFGRTRKSKLSQEDVKLIVSNPDGLTQATLAAKFGVHRGYISNIQCGRKRSTRVGR